MEIPLLKADEYCHIMNEFLLHGEEVIKYQKENQHLIDDNIRNLAADFGVEPVEILGHVLEYKIEWK